MRKPTGLILRFTGLLIEMLGIWGVLKATGDKDEFRLQLPGGTVVSLAWIAVGLGFVFWLTGTVLVYATRPKRNARALDEEERQKENTA